MTTAVSTPTDHGAIRDAYQRDGYVLVKGLIRPEEAREMRQEVHDLFRRVLTGRDGAWGSARARSPGLRTNKNCKACTTYSSILRSSAHARRQPLCRRRRSSTRGGGPAVAPHQGIRETPRKRSAVPATPGLPLLSSHAGPSGSLYLPPGRGARGERVRHSSKGEPPARASGAH